MRIIGRRDLQDYFDHVGHQHGQDDRVVYVRAPLKPAPGLPAAPPGQVRRLVRNPGIPRHFRTHGCLRDQGDLDAAERRTVSFVIAAKWCFPVLGPEPPRTDGPLEILSPARHARWLAEDDGEWCLPAVPPEELVRALIRDVGTPIFRLLEIREEGRRPPVHHALVDERIPHLGSLGVAALVSPTQMWQEVYAVLSNVLRDDPDRQPPCEISNDDKIDTHGFDRKTSFRHPTR